MVATHNFGSVYMHDMGKFPLPPCMLAETFRLLITFANNLDPDQE